MAGRHLKALLAAHRDRDDLAFRRAAQAIIEEEEGKRHSVLAQDLRRLLASGSSDRLVLDEMPLPEPPKDRDSAVPLVDLELPKRHLSDLVLDANLAQSVQGVADEVGQWDLLDAIGVPRRNRLLLYGPPGCGKTSIASALACDLGRVLVTVRVESVISSYLGETAANLNRVMEFASSAPYVVLFDEFDSLGKDRDDPADHGELRRVVNSVLQMIDRYSGPSILVAATNHQQVLDNALWRRFDEIFEVPAPDHGQMAQLLGRRLMGRMDGEVDIESAASSLAGLPHAAGEYAVHSAIRIAVADDRTKVRDNDLADAIRATSQRRWQ